MKEKVIGYTAGVFDLFHVGHVNLLKFAKQHCDVLVVGLVSDEESLQRKGKKPIYPYEQRKQILEACRYVDKVYPHRACEDLAICNELNATVQFVGSDWKGTELYNKMEKEYAAQGKKILYTEYTQGISSTQVRAKLSDKK
ncbi:MAG: adenylyltransferase/cytidyltransferase family protein [Peptococcaceae bacterium]|nr:adenylyltransferase/cytidyltransferase family protein [Peptococcaceae bacterium]